MKSRGLIVLLVVALVALMLPAAPAQLSPSSGPASSPVGAPMHLLAAPAPAATAQTAPHPLVGFPRTVLIETFTAVWCIHCPAESQALHYLDDEVSHNVLSIAELHVCASSTPGDCLENYIPSDGTEINRETFYKVPGYPDVFFDGNHPIDGATNSASQMQTWYEDGIANASVYPGNVSIAQNAQVTSTQVTDTTNITSDLTGSYNVVTYLVEYIDKLNVSNGYGPHDVDHVVRLSLMNHPVSLTAGQTTQIHSSAPLNASWKAQNLSVITLVQDNSTHVIENANMATVTTLTTGVSANVSAALSGTESTVTVTVHNSSTGNPLSGAAVSLSVQGGGSITPASGTTGPSGTFTAVYTAPTVTVATEVNITANVTAANYTGGSTVLPFIINPWVLPLVPTGLTVTAASSAVPLTWSAPSSGGVGLTYYIYRATTSTGPFVPLATSTSLSYTDSEVATGQSYWYTVAAKNAGGFSPNTTATSATELSATPQGLPGTVGWWISFGTSNFSVAGGGGMVLYLPAGTVGYSIGPSSYAYLAPTATGTLTAKGVSLALTAVFEPRYASLTGTVSPANALVTVNGSAVAVSDGSYSDLLIAGTYVVIVSASGFRSNETVVILTPGNLTQKNFDLAVLSSTGGGGSTGTSGSSGLTGSQVLIVLVGVAAAAAILIVAAAVSRGRQGGQRPRRRAPPENEMEP